MFCRDPLFQQLCDMCCHLCTFSKYKIYTPSVQQQSLSNMNEETANVIRDHRKQKTPPADIHAFQKTKKQKGYFYAFIIFYYVIVFYY